MDAATETLRLDYDAENDVLRAFVGEPAESIAIPSGSSTILVSENLDRVVGFIFEHYCEMLKRGNPALEAVAPERIFESTKATVEPIIDSTIRSLGPVAKDRVAFWLELAKRP